MDVFHQFGRNLQIFVHNHAGEKGIPTQDMKEGSPEYSVYLGQWRVRMMKIYTIDMLLSKSKHLRYVEISLSYARPPIAPCESRMLPRHGVTPRGWAPATLCNSRLDSIFFQSLSVH